MMLFYPLKTMVEKLSNILQLNETYSLILETKRSGSTIKKCERTQTIAYVSLGFAVFLTIFNIICDIIKNFPKLTISKFSLFNIILS